MHEYRVGLVRNTDTRVVGAIRVLIVVLALIGALAPRASAAPKRPPPDWVLITGEVPADTTMRGHGRMTGEGPLVVGYGHASEGLGYGSHGSAAEGSGTVYVSRIGGDGLSLRLGRLGLDVRLVPGTDRFTITEHIYGGDGTTAVLFFVANAVIAKLAPTSPETNGFGPDTKITTGTGSRALAVSDAGVGPVGAGRAEGAIHMPRGIVGGYDWNCVACSGRWVAPGGRGDGFSAAQLYGNQVFLFAVSTSGTTFAGPPGRWALDWTGATDNDPYNAVRYGPQHVLSSPVYAAYAPIGRAWRLFGGLDGFRAAYASDSLVPGASTYVCAAGDVYTVVADPLWELGAGVPRGISDCP